MAQKLIKVGSSTAVVIPKTTLKDLGLRAGDSVKMEVNSKSRKLSFEPVVKEVDKELLNWTKKFIERYRPALEALADK